MKNILNFLKLVASILGFGSSLGSFKIINLILGWVPGQKSATITISFDNLTGIDTTIITAIITLIEAHEHFEDSQIVGNDLIVTINV